MHLGEVVVSSQQGSWQSCGISAGQTRPALQTDENSHSFRDLLSEAALAGSSEQSFHFAPRQRLDLLADDWEGFQLTADIGGNQVDGMRPANECLHDRPG